MQSLGFQVDGCVFRLETNSKALLDQTAKDFGRFACSIDLPAEAVVRLTESVEKWPIRVPEYALRDSFGANESAVFTHSGRRYVLVRDDCAFEIDLRGRSIDGYFRPEYPVWTFFRMMLKWFVITNLELKGVHYLHASAGLRGDVSVFFVGHSGFGKTSSLLTLLGQDYRMIADDMVFFDEEKVYPFHYRSFIHSDMPEKFPALRKALEDRRTSEADGGWHVDLEGSFAAVHSPFMLAIPILLYVYVWNARETTWRELTKNEMVARMCNVYLMELGNSFWFGWNREKVAKDIFGSYLTLADRAKCYELRRGWDVREFDKSLFSLIESVSR